MTVKGYRNFIQSKKQFDLKRIDITSLIGITTLIAYLRLYANSLFQLYTRLDSAGPQLRLCIFA